jgi:hypothetical protein
MMCDGQVLVGAWCVVRGAWCVLCGAWCVVRGVSCVSSLPISPLPISLATPPPALPLLPPLLPPLRPPSFVLRRSSHTKDR